MNQELKKKCLEVSTLIKERNFQIALSKINKLIEDNPFYLYLYGLRGEILFFTNRYDEASDDFVKCSESKQLRIKSLSMLGLIKSRKGEFREAEGIYEKILKDDKTNTSAHNNLGNIYFKTGKEEQSVYQYKQVLQIDPANIGALKNLARIYKKQKSRAKVTKIYEDILEISPEDTDAFLGLIGLYIDSNKIEEAIIEIKKSLS
tara:strand:- start:2 stop:613 length:612 start_codon:yes stop_codon:yes gene_type:complete